MIDVTVLEVWRAFQERIGPRFRFVDCKPEVFLEDIPRIETQFAYLASDASKPYCQDHFADGEHILPGSLLLEAMAQASGILATILSGSLQPAYLAGFKDFDPQKIVFPESQIFVTSTFVDTRFGFYFFNSVAKNPEGEVLGKLVRCKMVVIEK